MRCRRFVIRRGEFVPLVLCSPRRWARAMLSSFPRHPLLFDSNELVITIYKLFRRGLIEKYTALADTVFFRPLLFYFKLSQIRPYTLPARPPAARAHEMRRLLIQCEPKQSIVISNGRGMEKM